MIPDKLKSKGLSFIKLRPPTDESDGKAPAEKFKNKPGNHYDADQIKQWKAQGSDGNYAVLFREDDDYIGIDADTAELERVIDERLPPTFTVRTGRGGKHYYFKLEDKSEAENLTLDFDDENHGHLQFQDKYLVGPNSKHGGTGNLYEIYRDEEIAEITWMDIKAALEDYLDVGVEITSDEKATNRDEINDIDFHMSDMISKSQFSHYKGNEFFGSHPVHGSESGRNFYVDFVKDQWKCFRCGTGGGPIQFAAVEAGVISCGESNEGAVSGKKFMETIDYINEQYGKDIDINAVPKDLIEKLKEFQEDPDKLGYQTEFFILAKNIDELENKRFGDPIEVPKNLIEDLKDYKVISKRIYKCGECGEFIFWDRTDEPYICPICDEGDDFSAVFPTEHDRIAEVINHNYHFATPKESIQETKVGHLHVYDGGIYRQETGHAVVRQKTREYMPSAKTHWQKQIMAAISDQTQVEADDFGAPVGLITFENGVLDIEKNEMLEHDPELYALAKIPIEYDTKKDYDCPMFKDFLRFNFENEEDVIICQEVLGSALLTEKLHKKLIMLAGDTDAGKSAFIRLIKKAIGEENVSAVSLEQLSTKNNDFQISHLRGALMNINHESDQYFMNRTDTLKSIADGNEMIWNQKWQQTMGFSPHAEHIFATNITPACPSDDNSFWNRFFVLIFPRRLPEKIEDECPTCGGNDFEMKFNRIKTCKQCGQREQYGDLEKDIIDEERKGIIQWLVRGARRFLKNDRKFSYDQSDEETRRRWKMFGDALSRFSELVCYEKEGVFYTTRELYDIYRDYCDALDKGAVRRRKFTERIQKEVHFARYADKRVDGKTQPVFENIEVKEFNSDGEIIGKNIERKKKPRDYTDDDIMNELVHIVKSEGGVSREDLFRKIKARTWIESEEKFMEFMNKLIDENELKQEGFGYYEVR